MLLPRMSDLDAIRTYLALGGFPGRASMVTADTFDGLLADCLSDGRVAACISALLKRERIGNRGRHVLGAVCTEGVVSASRITGITRGYSWDMDGILSKLRRTGQLDVIGGRKCVLYRATDPMARFQWRVVARMEGMQGRRVSAQAPEVGAFMRPEFTGLVSRLLGGYGAVAARGTPPGFQLRIGDGDGRVLVRCEIRGERLAAVSVESVALSAAAVGGRPMLVSASGFEPEAEGLAEETGVTLIGPTHILGRAPMPPVRKPAERATRTVADGAAAAEAVPE